MLSRIEKALRDIKRISDLKEKQNKANEIKLKKILTELNAILKEKEKHGQAD